MEKKNDRFLDLLKDIIGSFVISLIVVFVITQFLVRPVRVDGLSMYPTLEDEEVGFSNIIGLRTSELERYDVVVVHLQDRQRYIVKRIIGLPGETVEARKGVLYINGNELEEPYLESDYVKKWNEDNDGYFTNDFGPVYVPENSYFILGDNRQHSSDSRNYGSFHKDLIKSKGVFVIFPLDNIRNAGG